ncbi:MAG: class I SAM-dependent methyltransferase [Bacteroidia bacterium]
MHNNAMYQYRERFYKQYYRSQAGRSNFKSNREEKLLLDQKHFGKEILPLVDKAKDARILDIGCGYGSLLYTFKKAGYTNCIGIDLSEEQIRVAHELGIPEAKMEDLRVHLKAHLNTYDVITGMDIIEHFSKDEVIEVLDLVRDALKPDGLALFRTPNVDAPYSTVFYFGDFTHENFLNFSSATQLMENIGFRKVQVLSSTILVQGVLKDFIRRICWHVIIFFAQLTLFASGRSKSNVIFTPNLVIRVRK